LSHLSTQFGFKLNKDSYELCDVCHWAKYTRNPFPHSKSKAQRSFFVIHYDLWEPYHTCSLSGCYYFCVLRMTLLVPIYLLKDMFEACTKLINFCNIVKTQFNTTVQKIRRDNGHQRTIVRFFLLSNGCFIKPRVSIHLNKTTM